jgi:uncharacterized protein YjbI with pentapeptide repeats
LLDQLLDALCHPATTRPRFGVADFESATFDRTVDFRSAAFEGDASFGSAIFNGHAWFGEATFNGRAWFNKAAFQAMVGLDGAVFKGDADFPFVTFADIAGFTHVTFERTATFQDAIFQKAAFYYSTFEGDASFLWALFEQRAGFGEVTFKGEACFIGATFKDALFRSATFQGEASFKEAVFERTVRFGPVVCAGLLTLSEALFGGPVTLAIAARRLECQRTRWSSTAELRLRYATVNFAQAVFEYPLMIATEASPFRLSSGQPMAEDALAATPDAGVRMASLRGVDAAHLVLSDVDLSGCLFTGTVHLDQVRLEGACTFGEVPPRTHWRHWRPVRFTQRRTVAEEQHWRASQPMAVRGWNTAVLGAGQVGPAQLAPVYRALRKAFEDSKNEPGAADFYYGEMEMRRHNRTDTTHAERGLLHGYWMLSGYGLRASRALGWLAAAMLVTIVLLMGFGLPKETPKQEATGTVPSDGGRVTFEIGKADPQNPTGNRYTSRRFEKALNVTLNSVVFRSSGQDLTTAGTYIEMLSRVTEPILLGLAVLAVRNRVKR